MLNPSRVETLVPDRITASLHGDLLYAMLTSQNPVIYFSGSWEEDTDTFVQISG